MADVKHIIISFNNEGYLMNKKFFSLFFLVTSILSAEALRVLNASKGTISNIVVTYSEGRFSSTSDICLSYLDANQTGITNFTDDIKSIRMYTLSYLDVNGVLVVEHFNGKEFYLPAELILNQAPEKSVHFIYNESAQKQVEEAALLHQASLQATKAKDVLVDSTKNAAQWITDTSKNAYESAKETVSKVFDKVRGGTEEVKEKVENTVHNTKEIAEQAQHVVENEAKEAQNVAEEIIS